MVQLRLQPDHLLGFAGPLVRLPALLLPALLVVVQPVAIALAVELDVLVLRLWAQKAARSAGTAPATRSLRGHPASRPPVSPAPSPPFPAPRPVSPAPYAAAPAPCPVSPAPCPCLPSPAPRPAFPAPTMSAAPRPPPRRKGRGSWEAAPAGNSPPRRFGSSRRRDGVSRPPRASRRAWRGQGEEKKRIERAERGAFCRLVCQAGAVERNAGGR